MEKLLEVHKESGDIRNKFLLLYFLCGYAHSCAFISVIELPRIPSYCPKILLFSNKHILSSSLLLLDFRHTCYFLLFSLPLRENNFKHKEKNHHGNSTCNNCHKHVIDCRCHICRCNWHPQIIKSITNQ